MNFIEDIKNFVSVTHLVKYYQFYLIKTRNNNFKLRLLTLRLMALIEKCEMALI